METNVRPQGQSGGEEQRSGGKTEEMMWGHRRLSFVLVHLGKAGGPHFIPAPSDSLRWASHSGSGCLSRGLSLCS